jgi:hypothetical protein
MELTGQQMADEVTGSSMPERWPAAGAWGRRRQQELGAVVAETPETEATRISSSEPPAANPPPRRGPPTGRGIS